MSTADDAKHIAVPLESTAVAFGADAVAATHSSRELVQCVAPPSVEGLAGAVAVRLVNNDAVYSVTVAFTYRPVIDTTSL